MQARSRRRGRHLRHVARSPYPRAGDFRLSIAGRIERLMHDTPICLAALGALASARLPDAWIAAVMMDNAVRDERHGFPFSIPEDVDVIYFDTERPEPEREREIEATLHAALPDLPWSVRNQSRMHLRNGHAPY